VAIIVAVCFSVALAAKEFVKPAAQHAKTYPAHDEHAQEHVTIAVDPYDSAPKAGIFKTDWRDHNMLPVYFVISNDSDVPVALTSMKIEWITANRTKLRPASEDDLYRRLGKIKRRGDEPGRNPLPLPLPRGGPKVGISKEAREEIDRAQFKAMAVEPHASQSGFLFFDVEGIREPLAGARLYVTGVQNGNGQELMYFEIPLDKYHAGQAAK
jgi:hypothetical protein